MKCFKWRTAEKCKTGQDLHCALKERYNAELYVVLGRSVTLYSPGHNNTSVPFYHNNNFCIYNVSLDCPGEVVTLTSKPSTSGLADGESCQDYFCIDTENQPCAHKICGSDIRRFNVSMDTQSFTGVLWSNENNSEGSFEIEARCSGHLISNLAHVSSGDNNYIQDGNTMFNNYG